MIMEAVNILYKTVIGRMFLRPFIGRGITSAAGRLLDTRLSKLLIGPFVRMNAIRTEDYVLDDIGSFNDFFRRRIRDGKRPVETEPSVLVAPCDGLLKVIPVEKGSVIPAKQSMFTLRSLLRDRRMAESFEGGLCLVFRLCVDNYHRYVYFDSGRKYRDRRIEGFFHTVRPAALEEFPVFMQNTREYSVIDTENFGRCVQMEVGAMLVGRIVNNDGEPGYVKRGQEKGYFEFGASTVIVLVPKSSVKLNDRVKECLKGGYEIPVRMGEPLGMAEEIG